MTIVFKVSDATKNKMLNFYKNKKRDKTPPYAIFQADESDTVITLYESNKVVFQGASADIDANIWRDMEKQITGIDVLEDKKPDKKEKEKLFFKGNIIGSDEVGTGDLFGPIVVSAAYVDKEMASFLNEFKIRDSKKMDDESIRKIVPQIINKVKYSSIILSNSDYNKSYSKDMNMNKIKAILHNKAIFELLSKIDTKPDYIIVDQFVNKNKFYQYLSDTNIVKNITLLEKAEDQVLSVAVAAIISRYIFLKEFDRLSEEYQIKIPKGASKEVDNVAILLAKKHGIDELNKLCKMNFKNIETVKASLN